MTDTITLPRAVAEQARDALESLCRHDRHDALAALDAALGAEMSATGDDCRQPATVEQVIATHGPPWGASASPAFFSGWRAAERHHGIGREDGK